MPSMQPRQTRNGVPRGKDGAGGATRKRRRGEDSNKKRRPPPPDRLKRHRGRQRWKRRASRPRDKDRRDKDRRDEREHSHLGNWLLGNWLLGHWLLRDCRRRDCRRASRASRASLGRRHGYAGGRDEAQGRRRDEGGRGNRQAVGSASVVRGEPQRQGVERLAALSWLLAGCCWLASIRSCIPRNDAGRRDGGMHVFIMAAEGLG